MSISLFLLKDRYAIGDFFRSSDSQTWLHRGAIHLGSGTSADCRYGTPAGAVWLHSPGTVSALTYTVQLKNIYTAASWNETAQEVATITLMEIEG